MKIISKRFKAKVSACLLVFLILVQSLIFSQFINVNNSSIAYAATCPSASGTQEPTGASALTFSFNPATCLWENDYYTWDPITKAYTPKYSQIPRYNAENDTWEYDQWDYVAALGAYQLRIVSYPANLRQSNTISDTGEDSANTINSNQNNNVTVNTSATNTINNFLTSVASTGDAGAINNTTAGNVTSGDATAVANYLNMIDSSWDIRELLLFTATINNYQGDLIFNPNSILQTGANSTNGINSNDTNNVVVNNTTNNTINNNIDLTATSGDATASGNTNVGDTTSGNANTVANIFNLINSAIGSGQSFLGSINIYGLFDGDILLPLGVATNLIENTGASSGNSITSSDTTTASLTNNVTNTVNNNVDLNATTGNVDVSGNTTAGDATTGDAKTELNVFTQIGQNVTANNGLLVFINVLGTWHGLLFNIPETNSILSTGSASINNINSNNTNNVTLNNTETNTINNNLNLNSSSGDVSVINNTSAGNARSGDASASANIFNAIGSSLGFNDWFGVLFINVFGEWTGSFGVDTEAGGRGGGFVESSSGSSADSASFVASAFNSVASSYSTGAGSSDESDDSSQASNNTGTSSTSTEKRQLPTIENPAKPKNSSSWGFAVLLGIVTLLVMASRRQRS